MWAYHLSARVPWHDLGWNGSVCKEPGQNTCCSVLKGVREVRDIATEIPLHTRHFSGLKEHQMPPCAKEGSGFMSDQPFQTEHEHPYAYIWDNLQKTTLRHAPYSVCVVPFERMRKEVAADHSREWDLDYQAAREPDETKHRTWVNDDRNQESLLDGFFDVLRPEDSLVFFYAKKTPLTEGPALVLVGVARIADIPKGQDWAGSDQGKRQVFWDRVIPHTLRPDFSEGFIMPYASILEKCRAQDIDATPYTAFVPEGTGTDFQYRAGLVSSDSAVAALRALERALVNAIRDFALEDSWNNVRSWLRQRISECWIDRGPCPGLRAALSAVGLPAPSRAALEIHQQAKSGNPWPLIESAVDGNPATPRLARFFRSTSAAVIKLQRMRVHDAPRYQVLQLLSRFNLTREQATAWFRRADASCAIDDPYQLYLRTRRTTDPIPFLAIDRTVYGVRPRQGDDVGISPAWHAPADDDVRRVAAITVEALERGAQSGHTWLPDQAIVQSFPTIVEDKVPQLPDADLAFLDTFLIGVAYKLGIRGERAACDGWQLERFYVAETLIRDEVNKRLNATDNLPAFDARALVDDAIGTPVQGARDESARIEKALALETVASSTIATIDGPAGTGKTSLIKALVNIPNIGNVLCLAPTGKARVQIERSFQCAQRRPSIKTVHSFLLELKRWDFTSGHFDASRDGTTSHEYSAIIVDEASMFDVEMLAAVLAAGVHCNRIILIGDPRQLPPIGPGRPFVDIVEHFRATGTPAHQLRTIMRPTTGAQAPFEFARLFDLSRAGLDDELWNWPNQGSVGNLHFKFWKNGTDLRDLIKQWIQSQLIPPGGSATPKTFDEWLGATPSCGSHYFGLGCGPRADDWQILSPRRAGTGGSDELNLQVKDDFRRDWLTKATEGVYVQNLGRNCRIVPRPVGASQAVYGDKVICNVNHWNEDFYSKLPKPLGYVANGEVGIAIGPRRTRRHPKLPLKKLGIEFSSQLGTEYKFWVDDDDTLELAYALTVHRSQGSQFKETVVVVPDTKFVGPEMVYTALTRSEGAVTLLIERDAGTLLAATHPKRSAVGRRLTNLFKPSHCQFDSYSWFDSDRIHLATDGTYVRSKSELVIANLLSERRVKYEYEAPLTLAGQEKRPDFTIRTSKCTYYWEHLGMLTDPGYASSWREKEDLYKQCGITTCSDMERLVVTRDNPDGSLDSQEIGRVIHSFGFT